MSDQLIDDYVRDLRVSAWIRQLPPPRTAALERDVRERIAAALTAAGNNDEATVYGVLDRLGPPGDIVAQRDDAPTNGADRAIGAVLAPLSRFRIMLAARGWGVAEIGGLLLLLVGPYILWWIGPIFGIILVRAAANRWSQRATHYATVVVFALLTVQAVIALALIAYVLIDGGSLAYELQRVMSGLALHALSDTSAASGPLSVLRFIGASLAPIAGLVSGIYLALSPRFRG